MIEDPQPTTCPSSRATRSSTSRKPLGARGVVALDQHAEPSPGVQGTDKNPMKDKRVREALSLAINRDALVERVMGGVALPRQPAALPHVRFQQGACQGAQGRCGKGQGAARSRLSQRLSITLGSPSGRYVNDQGGAGDRVHVDAHRREDQRGCDGAAGVLQEPRFLCVLGLSGGLVGDQRRDVQRADRAAGDAQSGSGPGHHQPQPLLQPQDGRAGEGSLVHHG